MSIEWLECPDCAGSGYDTTGFQIFCPACRGAKVLEVEIVGDPEVAE
jgi:DnaJ-class molecular chaperone